MKKENKSAKEYYDSVYKPALVKATLNTKNHFLIAPVLSFVDKEMDKIFSMGGIKEVEKRVSEFIEKIRNKVTETMQKTLQEAV